MKRTTMTVAAFMVAAAASYAAAVTPKNAGVEVTVEKGKTEASVEITLKKGIYALASDKGTLAAKLGDANVADLANIVVGDAGATLKVTVTFAVAVADDKGQTVKLNLTPNAADWKAYVEVKQNTLSVAFAASQALPQNPGFEVTKREALLNEGIELQKKINALGIEDYNKYLEEGGKLADLDSKLADYEKKANDATANKAQYDKAIVAWEDIIVKNLNDAYDASEKTPSIEAAYKAMQKAVADYRTSIDEAYEAGTAATTFTDEKIKEGVKALQDDIDALTKDLASGNENLLAYKAVNTEIASRINAYNLAVDEIYRTMVAIEADTYQDYYTKALAELNKKLKIINDVKAANQAAYDAGTHTTKQQDDMVAKLPAANKDAFIDTEIKAQIAEVESLHDAYVDFVEAIDDYKANKDAYNDAVNDERKDSKGAVIKTYFSDKRNVIFGTNRKKGMLDNLRAQLDAQNKLHKHTDETTWNTGDNSWENIEAKKAELDADLAEYNAFVNIQDKAEAAKTSWDNDVKEAAKRGIKQKVEDMTKDGFVATAHFSSDDVVTALENYEKGGNVYVLGIQYDKDAATHTPCQDFLADQDDQDTKKGEYELKSVFVGKRIAYFNAANTAWGNFNTINNAIVGYNDQVNGKGEAGKDGYVQSWANAVKNGNVIVDIRKNYDINEPTDFSQIGTQTYADALAVQQDIKDAAKKALDDALKLGPDKADDFSDALAKLATTGAVNAGNVKTAANKIADLKTNYSADEATWFSYTNYKAAADALEEANDKVTALTKKIQTGEPADYISYAAADYGTAAAAALDAEISNSDEQKPGFEQQIAAQQTAIGKVSTVPAEALPALGDAQKALAEIEKAIDAHLEKAKAYKATFKEVKDRKDNINKQINGNADPKDEVASIINLLGTVKAVAASEPGSNAETVKNNFTAKVTAFNDALTTLWNDIDAAADIKAGLADVKDKDGKVTKEGFNTRLDKILNDANNHRTLAVNEDANQKAKNEWDGLIQKYRTIKVNDADVDQSVAEIVAAAEASIKAANGDVDVTTNGEQYFLNLINDKVSETEASYGAQINAQNTAAGTAHTAKNKDGYTDTEKNLVKMLPTLKTNLKNIIDTVDGLGAKAKQNEEAYQAQDKKLKEVENLYDEVNLLISSSESYNGTNYQAAFKAAVEKLTKLNTQIKKYGKDKDTWYASGACHTQDAGASTIASYGDQLTTIKQEWEAGDNSYNAAVAADNLNLKKEYDTEWQKLYDFYYGTTTQKGAIDNVTRLKSLTVYSDQVTDAAIKAIASGETSIYTKAAKIQELKDKADAAFAALKAGENWVAGQAAQIDAVDALKAEIDKQQKDYAAAINALINTEYNTALGKANAAVAEAEQAVQVVLGVTDAEEKEKLVELAKANNQTVYDIVKRAVDIKKEVDFAYLFVEENTKSLLETTVPALCLDAKNLAAQKKYAEVYDQINTANEAAQIAEFYYTENYATSSKSSDFTKGGYSDAYAQYLEDEWQYVHSTSLVSMKNYTNAIGNLNRQLTSYIVVKTDGTTESKLCTSAFYEAWNANEQYNTILKAEFDLAAARVELDAAKAKAKNYAANLLVEHDATIESALDITIKTAAEKDYALSQVVVAIDGIFKKEYVTLGLEITKLVQLQGEPTEASDALNATNERIYSDLTSGKKDADGNLMLDENGVVKATYDETYEAYLQLEKDLSDALNKVVENALPDAQAAVAAAVDEAKAAVAVAAEKQQAAHTKNKADFADDIEALNAALDQLDKKIELQGNAIVLEQDNNIKSAQDIKANAEAAAYDINLKETYYVANDNIVEGFDEDIENLNNKLTRTVASINALEYIAKINENGWWNNDYAKYVSESVLPEIEKIETAKAKLEGVLDANDGKFEKWNDEVGIVKDKITSEDNYINRRYNYALLYDANFTGNALANAFSDLGTYVYKNTITMDTEEKASVDQQIKDLENKINRVNEYINLVFPSWWEEDEIVRLDRDVYGNQEVEYVDDEGNVTYKSYSISREQGHAQYKAACAEIVKEMQDIRNSIVTPGAIIDGNEVTGADVAIMVDFILEKKAPETDAQRKAADVNGNGVFDVADLQAIVNMFLYDDYKGKSKAPARQAVNAETIGSMGMFLNTSELNLTLDTEMAYTAVQMDVTLPAGVILTDAAMAAQAEGVSVKFNKVAENTWRVLAFSSQNHNIIEGLDFINLGLAGQGAGVVSIDNVKGAMTRGVLVSIPGVQQNMEVATGINATLAQAKAYIYGIDGTVRESIGKGINIVKDAANKVKKVLKK